MGQILEGDEEIDPKLAEYLLANDFIGLRKYKGILYGVSRYMFTFGLCTHVSWSTPHMHRWCFSDAMEAMVSLAIWNGEGDPPGPWTKQKYMTERNNPILYTHKGGTWYERNTTDRLATWLDRGNVIERFRDLPLVEAATRVAKESSTAV